eukprot:scaffold190_cov171-Amphora_coffeaeformis.AAC.2
MVQRVMTCSRETFKRTRMKDGGLQEGTRGWLSAFCLPKMQCVVAVATGGSFFSRAPRVVITAYGP